MEFNPFAIELSAQQAAYDRLGEQMRGWSSQLNWFQQLDLEKVHKSLKATERVISTATGQLDTAKQNSDALRIKVGQLKENTSLGFDPRYWFSDERARAKQQLLVAEQDMALRQWECGELKVHIQDNEKFSKQVKMDIARYRSFDELLAQATLRGLQVELEQLEPQLSRCRKRKDDLDSKLEVPLHRLTELESEREQLARELSRADQFEEDLSNAQTGRERALIHEECGRMFDDSQPKTVARNRRSMIQRVEADIGKLKGRIEDIIKRVMRDVRTLVIDGNNLCYQQNEFIGLSALESLVPKLVQKYEVKLIFDSDIRGMLRTKDREIRGRFPQASSVHVVASKTKADETILDVAAGDKHTFVISNDRFADFPEKDAVFQGHILKHEIVNDTVHISDLNILVKFCRPGRGCDAAA